MIEFTSDIDNLLDLVFKVEKQASKKKILLDKGKIVYLQIGLFKSPIVRTRKRKFLRLCHSLYGDDPEICLFVPNRKTGVEYKKTTDELIDFCVDHYTELLEKHKIKGITTVMPVKQLRSEYGTYELRKKLAHRFDLFLCKNSLLFNPRFLTGLGKIFKVANKEPLGVSFPAKESEYDPNFEKNIKRAIFASTFYINPFSDNYSIPFGTLSHTKTELKENLMTVLEQISSEKLIPGGFNNIRAIYIWPSQSKTIPLYICPELPEKLPKLTVRGKRRGIKVEEGELSTQPGKKVTVMPSGEVFVTNISKNKSKLDEEFDDEDEDSFHDGSDEEENEEEDKKIKPKPRFKGEKKGNEDESESEDDEEIEKMEQRLLKLKREADDDSFKKPKKIKREDAEDSEVVVKKENKVKKNGNAKIISKKEKVGKKKNKVEEKVKPKIGKKKIEKSSKKLKIKQEKFKLNEKGKRKNKSKEKIRA